MPENSLSLWSGGLKEYYVQHHAHINSFYQYKYIGKENRMFKPDSIYYSTSDLTSKRMKFTNNVKCLTSWVKVNFEPMNAQAEHFNNKLEDLLK